MTLGRISDKGAASLRKETGRLALQRRCARSTGGVNALLHKPAVERQRDIGVK
jgi:hypothetical protein